MLHSLKWGLRLLGSSRHRHPLERDLTGLSTQTGKGQTPSGLMCPTDPKRALSLCWLVLFPYSESLLGHSVAWDILGSHCQTFTVPL